MSSASVSGKIILSGEYAVVFGYAGIAIPSELRVNVTFNGSQKNGTSTIIWNEKNLDSHWIEYAEKISKMITKVSGVTGVFAIDNHLPLGKGMGSSTAIVIAMCKAALGSNCEQIAHDIEDSVNPGNSGLDFAVIWHEKALMFKKGHGHTFIDQPKDLRQHMRMIDTGTPNETTPALVAWVKSREKDLEEPLAIIGRCTERILNGEHLKSVIKDHHCAQIALGIVPKKVQEIITAIEKKGGAAKVLGAGARTGGGGMVLVLD